MRIFYTVVNTVILQGIPYITANLYGICLNICSIDLRNYMKRSVKEIVQMFYPAKRRQRSCQFQKSERGLEHYHREKCTLIIHLSLSVSMSIMLCSNKCLFSMHYRENIHFSSNFLQFVMVAVMCVSERAFTNQSVGYI